MSTTPYEHLPPTPERIDAAGILARLVDGLAFRFRWATEDLDESLHGWRAADGSMTMGEVLEHVRLLASWVHDTIEATIEHEPDGLDGESVPATGSLRAMRDETLRLLWAVRTRVETMTPQQLDDIRITGNPKKGSWPFWHMINGPLADALTHVGQISAWRRAAGDPAPRADVFRGRPPRATT